MNEFRHRVCIPPDHPCLAGHFPGQPIVPGVLLLQQVIDAASLWHGIDLFARRVDNVKFLSPLRPGEVMDITLSGERPTLHFRCECEGRLLAQGALQT